MIDSKSLAKSFIKFIRIDSPTGKEKSFSDFLASELKKAHIKHVSDKRGNIVAYIPGQGKPLLLAAHTDTVQPGVGIKPIFKNGVFKSSGNTILGADNKAAVAILFELAKSLRLSKATHRPLEILFSVSEEAGTSGVDTLKRSLIKSKEGLCFDCAQPVGTIITGSPFYISESIKIIGKSSDISSGKGIGVIAPLARFLKNAPQGKIGSNSMANIGVISGGFVANAILSEVNIKAEVRSFDKNEAAKIALKTKTALNKAMAGTNCRAIFSDVLENCGYNFNGSEPLVKKAVLAMSKIVPANSIKLISKYWGIADANNLNRLGIKTINIAYGAKEPHTVRERISISDMIKISKFVGEFIKI